MRKLFYTALVILGLGCSGNGFYHGRVISEQIWQHPEGSYFYRMCVEVDKDTIPFNVEETQEFLDSLDNQINVGDMVRIKGKNLESRVPFINNNGVITIEPITSSERLSKIE